MSKIFGVPLVLILLVLFIIVPLLFADIAILRAIDKKVSQTTCVEAEAVVPTPSVVATPSASVSPTGTLKSPAVPVLSTTPAQRR